MIPFMRIKSPYEIHVQNCSPMFSTPYFCPNFVFHIFVGTIRCNVHVDKNKIARSGPFVKPCKRCNVHANKMFLLTSSRQADSFSVGKTHRSRFDGTKGELSVMN